MASVMMTITSKLVGLMGVIVVEAMSTQDFVLNANVLRRNISSLILELEVSNSLPLKTSLLLLDLMNLLPQSI